MNSMQINTEIMPISGITKEVINQAQDILKEINTCVLED